MYHNIVIIGNKNYKNLELNKILDFFGNNIRFNFGIPCNNNGTIYDNIVLNNHVYEYSKKSLQEKIDKYCKLFSISETHIEKFHNNLNKFKNIEKQINDWKMINNFLEKISCPYKYTHLPRVGYLKMMQLIMNNIKPFIYGFSIYSIVEEHLYVKNLYYGNKEDDPIKRTGHNELNEIEILKWLHNNNYIDATLCLLEDEEICTLNCSILKPKSSSLCIILKCKGLLVLKNFYEEIIIEKFKSEVCNIFDNNKKIIQKAISYLKVLKTSESYTYLELNPITGRKHQLRKQLFNIGHSIYGDKKYKSSSSIKGMNKDLMLHSYQIKFMINDNKHTYKALLPDYFQKLLKIKRLNFSN